MAPYFARFSESLSDLAIAAAVAGRDEVGDTAALQEGGGGDGTVCAEDLGKGNHLHQAETNHRSFGVVPESQAITETCSHCHNVLQRGQKEKVRERSIYCNAHGNSHP